MLNVLILEDKDYKLICSSLLSTTLGQNQNIKFLNTDKQKVIIGRTQVADVLTAHKDKIDLLITDLLLPDNDNHGLSALQDWLEENDLDSKQLNFGIIAVTSDTSAQAKKVLGVYPREFGNSFLGLAPKDANLTANLERLIENGFFNPPFVKGGDKFYNTRLVGKQFKQFNKDIIIKTGRINHSIDTTINFKDIIAVEKVGFGDELKIYQRKGQEIITIAPIHPSAEHFFKDYCYDPTFNEHKRHHYEISIDLSKEEEIEYIPLLNKQNEVLARFNIEKENALNNLPRTDPNYESQKKVFKKRAEDDEKLIRKPLKDFCKVVRIPVQEKWESEKENIRKDAQMRIKEHYAKQLPVFINVNSYLAVNIIYLSDYGSIKGVQKANKSTNWQMFKDTVVRDTSGFLYVKTMGNSIEPIPVNGGIGRSSGQANTIKSLRIYDDFTERTFAFNELYSDRWKLLLDLIRRYLGVV